VQGAPIAGKLKKAIEMEGGTCLDWQLQKAKEVSIAAASQWQSH